MAKINDIHIQLCNTVFQLLKRAYGAIMGFAGRMVEYTMVLAPVNKALNK